MKDIIVERSTNKEYEEKPLKGARFLYDNFFGRIILFFASKRFVSVLAGKYLDTKGSKKLIPKFIKNNNIDMSYYEKEDYKSFNDFFVRRMKKESLKINGSKKNLLAPASSKLTVYEIDLEKEFTVKNKKYTVKEILRNESLAKEYAGGYFLVFRLGVDDYHRYYYIDDGSLVKEYKINGKFHSVGPIAFKRHKIFSENQREYAILKTNNFDKVIQMEIGAMMVGKIVNHKIKKFRRGLEKGYFKYGGSTVVLIIKKDVVEIDKDILENSKNGKETKVRVFDVVGRSIKK